MSIPYDFSEARTLHLHRGTVDMLVTVALYLLLTLGPEHELSRHPYCDGVM